MNVKQNLIQVFRTILLLGAITIIALAVTRYDSLSAWKVFCAYVSSGCFIRFALDLKLALDLKP